MAVPVVSVNPAPAPISDLAGSLIAGGSLAVGKSYYYVAVAYRTSDASGTLLDQRGAYSGVSNEVGPFTPTAGNQSVQLTFTLPPGATAVILHRRESTWADYTYSRQSRLRPLGLSYATCTGSPFTDTGAVALYYSETASIAPAGAALLPCGFDPIHHGAIAAEWYGGSAADPVTFADLASALAGSYPDYVHWDGSIFGFLGNLYLHASNECHFKDLARAAYIFGRWDSNLNSNANSELIFGELNYGKPNKVNTLFSASGGWTGLQGWNGNREKHYGSKFHLGLIQGFENWLPNSGFYLYDACLTNRAEVVNTPGTRFYYFHDQIFCKGFTVYGDRLTFWNPSGSKFLLRQENEAPYIYLQNGTDPRLDRFVLTRSDYVCDWYDTQANEELWALDMTYPNLNRADGFPEIYWRSGVPVSCKWREAVSVALRAVDRNGTAIEGADLTIKDQAANAVLDYDGVTAVNGTPADANGWFWRERVTVTAATANTVTDSSKSWGTDQWKGRNFACYKNGRLVGAKVMSNTATQLTLCENLAFTPAVGDKGGIRLEFSWGYLSHKSGSGQGAGSAYTDYLNGNPHTITITKTGYVDYHNSLTVNQKLELQVPLTRVSYPVAAWEFANV